MDGVRGKEEDDVALLDAEAGEAGGDAADGGSEVVEGEGLAGVGVG